MNRTEDDATTSRTSGAGRGSGGGKVLWATALTCAGLSLVGCSATNDTTGGDDASSEQGQDTRHAGHPRRTRAPGDAGAPTGDANEGGGRDSRRRAGSREAGNAPDGSTSDAGSGSGRIDLRCGERSGRIDLRCGERSGRDRPPHAGSGVDGSDLRRFAGRSPAGRSGVRRSGVRRSGVQTERRRTLTRRRSTNAAVSTRGHRALANFSVPISFDGTGYSYGKTRRPALQTISGCETPGFPLKGNRECPRG